MPSPLTRNEIVAEVKKMFDFGVSEFGHRVADLIEVERMKLRTSSDKSDGTWVNPNPHDPRENPNGDG